jgi:tetratricopeptide (TPR) repeat protein
MTHSKKRSASNFAATCALALVAGSLACVQSPARIPPPALRVEPLRLTEVAAVGDPARRASMRLLLAGLDHDIEKRHGSALGSYERALQVDPTNPYAYLAIARYRVEYGDPEGALAFLGQAESLFRSRGEISPRVAVNLQGLRGQALEDSGDVARGVALVAEASQQAPSVWSDGRLSAKELR